jgi:alpha-glucosidase
MDFTPGILSLEGRGQPILTTQAKQLALYVVLYSPIRWRPTSSKLRAAHAALPVHQGRPRRLVGEPRPERRGRRLRHHRRKDRRSENWYLGALTDEESRVLEVPLSFLTPGKRYRAQIYRDGPNAHYRTNAKDIVIEERNVTAADTLSLRLAPGGGQAIRFVAGR